MKDMTGDIFWEEKHFSTTLSYSHWPYSLYP
jgi:hypothetical protein